MIADEELATLAAQHPDPLEYGRAVVKAVCARRMDKKRLLLETVTQLQPVSRNALVEHLGWPVPRVQWQLDYLRRCGLIVCTNKGKGKTPLWRLL